MSFQGPALVTKRELILNGIFFLCTSFLCLVCHAVTVTPAQAMHTDVGKSLTDPVTLPGYCYQNQNSKFEHKLVFFFFCDLQSPFSISSSFILFFVLLPFFLITKSNKLLCRGEKISRKLNLLVDFWQDQCTAQSAKKKKKDAQLT